MRRPRLALSLRALLLLVLVVGLPLGWQIDREQRRRRAIEEVRRDGGQVYFADEMLPDGRLVRNARPPGPAWLRRLVGDEAFRRVRRINVYDRPLSDAILRPLADLPELENLTILPGNPSGPSPSWPLTVVGLDRLEHLANLRTLEIYGPAPVGIRSLATLRGSPRLERLELRWIGLTDAEMPPLATMPALRVLIAPRNRLEGTFLGPIAGTTGLVELDLFANPISDAGLAAIGRLPGLRQLNLGETGVEDAGLRHLSGLTGLRWLWLRETGVTDAGLAHLAGLSGLEYLNLSECAIGGRGLAHLRGLDRLTSLSLDDTPVDDDALAALPTLPRLHTLSLDGTRVTDAGLAHLARQPNLAEVTLNSAAVTDDGVERLQLARPDLGRIEHGEPIGLDE